MYICVCIYIFFKYELKFIYIIFYRKKERKIYINNILLLIY